MPLSHLVTSQVVLNLNSSPPLFSSSTSGSMIYTGRVGKELGNIDNNVSVYVPAVDYKLEPVQTK